MVPRAMVPAAPVPVALVPARPRWCRCPRAGCARAGQCSGAGWPHWCSTALAPAALEQVAAPVLAN
eukprot:11026297-Alexandrium_andersonii.AAC.1